MTRTRFNTGVDVTEQTFAAEVLDRSHEVPVVVDFWAEWCGPCRALAPVLERAVAGRADDVVLAKVDVDANPGLAARYGVHGIPAVKAFRKGEVVREFTGAQPPQLVEAFLDAVAGPSPAERLAAELRKRGEHPEVLAALEREDYEAALELLLAAVRDGVDGGRDEVRRMMVTLFAELGQDHPVAVRYRRALAQALY